MPELHDLLERRATRHKPAPDLFDRVLDRRRRRERNRRMGTAVVVLALAAAGIGGLLRTYYSGTTPASDPRSPFLGTWVTTDLDGSTPTMEIRAPEDGALEIVVHDDGASVCSGAPSTMRGTGRLRAGDLVVPSPVLTCDDGSEPQALSGPPLEEQLRNLTFVYRSSTDDLSDSLGSRWMREGEEGPVPFEGLDDSPPLDPSRFGGTWESTPGDTGFLGTWESTDVDGSSLLLGVRASEDPSDTFEVLLLDDHEDCYFFSKIAGPINMTGLGRVEGGELSIDSQTWICEAGSDNQIGPSVVSGDSGIKLDVGHTPLVHDPETDTLLGPSGRELGAPSWTSGRGLVWHRRAPGSDPISLPFWGVWPQSSLEEAEEAQRRADAGDPAFTWQLAPELATSPEFKTAPIPTRDAADRAEILTRFHRDVLGWEEYVTVAKRDPYGYGDAGWTFVRIRCGPGANPLYPNDPNGGSCPPTIGDNRYETVSLMLTQPVRSGPSGIWVVTDWTELARSEEPASDLRYHEWVDRQYEQVVPPSEAELVESLEAFLSARVAGEGAERYLTEGYYWPRPRVPLLYATTEGHRYERFEILKIEEPRWPAGVCAVTVRLFARGGGVIVEEDLAVWPGSEGQLTMDTWGRGGTTENGEEVPDRFGSE